MINLIKLFLEQLFQIITGFFDKIIDIFEKIMGYFVRTILVPKFLRDFDNYLLCNHPVVWRSKALFVLFYGLIGAILLFIMGFTYNINAQNLIVEPLVMIELGYDKYHIWACFITFFGILRWAASQYQLGFPFTKIKDTLLTLLLYIVCFSVLFGLTTPAFRLGTIVKTAYFWMDDKDVEYLDTCGIYPYGFIALSSDEHITKGSDGKLYSTITNPDSFIKSREDLFKAIYRTEDTLFQHIYANEDSKFWDVWYKEHKLNLDYDYKFTFRELYRMAYESSSLIQSMQVKIGNELLSVAQTRSNALKKSKQLSVLVPILSRPQILSLRQKQQHVIKSSPSSKQRQVPMPRLINTIPTSYNLADLDIHTFYRLNLHQEKPYAMFDIQYLMLMYSEEKSIQKLSTKFDKYEFVNRKDTIALSPSYYDDEEEGRYFGYGKDTVTTILIPSLPYSVENAVRSVKNARMYLDQRIYKKYWQTLPKYVLILSLLLFFVPFLSARYSFALLISCAIGAFLIAYFTSEHKTITQGKSIREFAYMIIPFVTCMLIASSANERRQTNNFTLLINGLFIGILLILIGDLFVVYRTNFSFDEISYYQPPLDSTFNGAIIAGLVGALLTTYVRTLPKA